MRQAIDEIELEISNLRAIISDLRPSSLDDLGLGPAIEALLERRSDAGVEIISELNLPTEDEGGPHLDPAVETTAYRLIQEALTNVIKHSGARTVHVGAGIEGDELAITVEDDGSGFDVSSPSSGFGLAGMRERVFLAGGSLELTSGETGTLVIARLRTSLGSNVNEVAS